MSERTRASVRRRKRAARGLTLCFVLTIALTGAYTWTNYKGRSQEQIEKTEEKVEIQETSTVAEKADDFSDPTDLKEKVEEIPEEVELEEKISKEVTSGETAAVYFTEDDLLLWPVDGSVKMSYSMDKTVYFETLDQYKYNPALIISAEENVDVIAAAPGTVREVEMLPQTGTTVTIDLGNGYECIYGQLKEICVKQGDYVAAGSTIGYLSEPTKYYALEGSNLYFEMKKNGESINPLDYVAGE